MRSRVSHRAFLTMLAVASLSRAVIHTVLADEPTPEQVALFKEAASNAFLGSISVSGTLKDGNGSTIENVRLFRQVVFGGHGEAAETNLNGAFSFNYTNCMLVDIEFSKDGYETAMRSYRIFNDPSDAGSTGSSVVHTNVVVTMRKIDVGDISLGVEGFVEFSEEGWWQVLPIRVGASPIRVTNVADAVSASGGWPCAIVLCQTNASGRIAVDGQGAAVDPRLSIVGAGTRGFCRLDGEGAVLQLVSSVDVAPGLGSYSNQMSVSQADEQGFCVTAVKEPSQRTYGKGVAYPGMVGNGSNKTFRCMIQVLLQTNGTQNVRGRLTGFL